MTMLLPLDQLLSENGVKLKQPSATLDSGYSIAEDSGN